MALSDKGRHCASYKQAMPCTKLRTLESEKFTVDLGDEGVDFDCRQSYEYQVPCRHMLPVMLMA